MQRQDAANAHSGEYSTPAEQSHSMSTIAHYMAQPSGKHLLTTKTGKIRIRSTRPIQHKAERAAGGKTYHTYVDGLPDPYSPRSALALPDLNHTYHHISFPHEPHTAVSPVTSRAVYFKPDTLGYGNRKGSPTIYGQSLTDPCSAGHQAHGHSSLSVMTSYSPQYSSVYYESDADDGLSDEDMPGLFSASTRRHCSKILSSDTARNYLPSYFGQGIIDDGAEADEESDGGE